MNRHHISRNAKATKLLLHTSRTMSRRDKRRINYYRKVSNKTDRTTPCLPLLFLLLLTLAQLSQCLFLTSPAPSASTSALASAIATATAGAIKTDDSSSTGAGASQVVAAAAAAAKQQLKNMIHSPIANNTNGRLTLAGSTNSAESSYYDASYFQPPPPTPSPTVAVAVPQPSDLDQSASPRSDRAQVMAAFKKFFVKARSHDDWAQKELVRDGVVQRMKELGFETSFLQKSRFEFSRTNGSVPAYSYNMISILPGKYRQTKQDRIVLVGAHWDTATKAPGVDDNGSGSACLLEIARLVSENRCKFEYTVMLVWFDYEEQGKYGSEFFVNDYLFPRELHKFGSKFIGAYIMDMILVRDREADTQSLPANMTAKLDYFKDELARERNRGDFLAAWSRRVHDEPLETAFRSSWTDLGYEPRTFKAMRPELPQARMPNSEERYEWKDFFRSDHASFWFPPLTSRAVRRAPNRTSSYNHTSLNAILLTDLGPWRRSYSRCYHSPCDDEHLLTDGNLSFMQQVIDSLVLTLLRVGHGECRPAPRPGSTQMQATTSPSGSLSMVAANMSATGPEKAIEPPVVLPNTSAAGAAPIDLAADSASNS